MESFENFKEILKTHEINTFSKFNVYQSPKGFLDEKREISADMKLHWKDGLPYFHFGSRIYTCHQGKDINLGKKKKYAEKKREKAMSDHIFQRTYNLTKTTKKLDCPVSITVTRVYTLPQFKLENRTKAARNAVAAKIKSKLRNNEDVKGEEAFWFTLPSIDAHKNHTLGEISAITEPVDSAVRSIINEVVCEGNGSALVIPTQNEVSDEVVIDAEDVSAVNERDAILNKVSGNGNSMPESLYNEKKEIIEMFSEVVAGLTADKIQLAKKMVLSLKAGVTAAHTHSGSFSTVVEKNPKRELVPQRRLYSTKKRKSSPHVHVALPDAEESNRIFKSLPNEGPNSTDVRPPEQKDHDSTLLQQDLQHRSCGLVSVAEENNSILCQEAVQKNTPGPVSIAVEENGSVMCQEVLQNGTPGPVSVVVEESESVGLLWQQELPHSNLGIEAKQCASVDHSYAKPYSTTHIPMQCSNATASKELVITDQRCLEAG